MPGIVGFVKQETVAGDRRMLERMVLSMKHEPSFTSGSHVEPNVGAGIGWVHRCVSYSTCTPVWNERRDICLLFSGEHFGERSEMERLVAGHECRTDDASCLVHLYEERERDFFTLLNGTFCGAILDLRQNKVVVFNDRFGLGRLYIHESAGGFYFASEAKALLTACPDLRKLDMRGLGELLVAGCTLQNRTNFCGVSLLPPASKWTFRAGEPVCRETYFSPETWEKQTRLEPETYFSQLKEVFTGILPRYFTGKQQIGLSLTGGLDSRMIIAGMDKPPGELPCYTFGGMYRESADVTIARRIARLCQQPHTTLRLDEGFFPNFLDLAQRCIYITDGGIDVSAATGLYVNRLAKDIAPVRMTGNYGSEILRGNVALRAHSVFEGAYSPDFAPYFKKAAETYAAEREGLSSLAFIVGKQVSWFHYPRLAEEQSELMIRAPYLDNELVSLAYRSPQGSLLNKQLAQRYTTEMLPSLANLATDRGLLEPPPFVPRKFFEFSTELMPHAEYRFDYGMPHWLAKVERMLNPLRLERLLLGRQKYYHFRTWYRYALAGIVKEVLLDPRTLSRPYLNRRQVEAIVDAHTSGTGNYTTEIHRLMTCELIQRQLIEN